MGIGTGGTIVGVGKYLCEKKPNTRIVGLAPRGSPILGGNMGDNIEGLASTLVPGIYSRHSSLINEVIGVTYDEAIKGVKELLTRGILAGPSSGANFVVAARYAMQGLRVVTLAADSILRYPELFEEL